MYAIAVKCADWEKRMGINQMPGVWKILLENASNSVSGNEQERAEIVASLCFGLCFFASRAAAVITTTPATLAWVMSMVTMSAAMRTLTMVAAPAPSIFLKLRNDYESANILLMGGVRFCSGH